MYAATLSLLPILTLSRPQQTYNLDRQVPDSAATATAFLAGVKANYYTVGVNGNVKMKDCSASIVPENQVDTIVKWAQDAGKDTGKVTLMNDTFNSQQVKVKTIIYGGIMNKKDRLAVYLNI